MIHQINERVHIIDDGVQYRVMLDNTLWNVYESLQQAQYHAEKLAGAL